MGSSPATINTPNPAGVAASQQQFNTTAGEMSQAGSNVNQSNWLGGTNFTRTGTDANGTPLYTANTYLSPLEQNLWGTGVSGQQSAANQALALLTGSNYGSMSPAQAIGNTTSGLTGDLVNRETSYLNPYFQAQQEQLQTQLENEGIMPSKTGNSGIGTGNNLGGGTQSPGDPAWNNAMLGLENTQANQLENFIAQTEPQLQAQATQEYTLPAQLAESLGTYGQYSSPTSQEVQTAGLNIQPADYEGAVNTYDQAQMANAKIQNDYNQSMMSGLFGIPTAVLGGWAKGGGLQALTGTMALAA